MDRLRPASLAQQEGRGGGDVIRDKNGQAGRATDVMGDEDKRLESPILKQGLPVEGFQRMRWHIKIVSSCVLYGVEGVMWERWRPQKKLALI